MDKILIINGPNLNLLGTRQTDIYGTETMDICLRSLKHEYPAIVIDYFQSNHEGCIIDRLHESGFDSSYIGIVLNAGAFTHTSLAIADAISSIKLPVVEVHISNIFSREKIRRTSLISPVCKGIISGFGLYSYSLAINSLLNKKH